MGLFNPSEGTAIKYQSVNSYIPASIVSSLTNNPKTAFDVSPAMLIPESTAVIGGVARISAAGLFSTGVVSLSLTLSIEMQGQIVASVSVTPALSLANLPWDIDVTATILSNGQVEVRGQASFNTSLNAATVMNIRNMTSFSMSTVGGVPVTVSAQWGVAAIGGIITLRQSLVQIT